MKISLKSISCLLILLSALVFPASGNQKIRVVMDNNYPPYAFLTENGELRGILVDYWREWEKTTGIKVELSADDWNNAISTIMAGEADIIDTMFYNKDRAAVFAFGTPYININVPVYVHRSLQGISDLKTLKGFVVGAKSGDNSITYLRKNGIDTIKEYPSYATLIRAAANGEVFVFTADEPPALFHISKLNTQKEIKKAFDLYKGSFHRAALKKNTELLMKVESGFDRIPPSRLSVIREKWTGLPLDMPAFWKASFYILVAGLALISILIIWSYTLNRKVKDKTSELNNALYELSDSERHYKDLFNNLTDVFFRTDLKGNIILVSPSCRPTLGYDEDELLTMNIFDLLVNPRDGEYMRDTLQRDNNFNIFRTFVKRKNADPIWISINAHISYTDQKREHLCIEGLARNINDLYLKEESVKRLDKFRKTIIDNTGMLICATDKNLNITLWNKAAGQITGYTFDEVRLMHSPWDVIISGKKTGSRVIKRIITNLQKNPEKSKIRLAITTKNGQSRIIDSIIKNLHDPHQDEHYIFIGHDVTEQISMENELIKNQKLESLGLLAGGIAHDFNNILTAITGNLSLADLVEDTSRIKGHIHEALSAAERAKGLTRQLLTFSKGGAPVKETASIAQLLRESAKFLFRGSNIKAVYNIHADFSNSEIDTGQINQVFNNIIINAMQALENKGRIIIACINDRLPQKNDAGLPPGDYIIVTISDNGPGIPLSHQDKIFDPFFTTKREGNGLGLPTSFSIIKRHGGTILFRSEPNKGTEFNIYLPASTNQTAIPVETYTETPSGETGGEKILVLDDETSILEILRDILAHLGYDVTCVNSSDKAMEAFNDGLKNGKPFNMAILDLILPGDSSGEETAARMKSLDNTIKLIASSGYSNNPVMADCHSYGFNGTLPKPFTAEDVQNTLNEFKTAGD